MKVRSPLAAPIDIDNLQIYTFSEVQPGAAGNPANKHEDVP